jgi:hypothetical protein
MAVSLRWPYPHSGLPQHDEVGLSCLRIVDKGVGEDGLEWGAEEGAAVARTVGQIGNCAGAPPPPFLASSRAVSADDGRQDHVFPEGGEQSACRREYRQMTEKHCGQMAIILSALPSALSSNFRQMAAIRHRWQKE